MSNGDLVQTMRRNAAGKLGKMGPLISEPDGALIVSGGGSGGSFTVSGPVTNRGIVLSGASETLIPAGTYNYIEIQNTGNANIAINIAGGVALAGSTSFTIPPIGSWASPPNFTPSNAITVIGTAGQPVSAFTG